MRPINLLIVTAVLALSASALTAQVNATTGVMPLPANSYGQWVVDINFAGAAHTENLTLTLTNSQIGFTLEAYDVGGMSNASNSAAWTPHAPVWNFPAQAPGSWNLQVSGGPWVTESMSGIHRFVFNVINPTTATNNITFTVANGGAATATVSGTPFFHTVTATPASGTPGPVTGTTSTAYVEHSAQFAFGISTLGASTDEVRFEFDVNFGATATTLNVGLFALINTGSNQLIFDLYSLSDDGGSIPSATISLTAGAAVSTDARTFTTGSYSGVNKFRVVVRAGTPFTGSHLVNFYISFDNTQTLGAAPATAAIQNQAPVSISPAGGNLTSSPATLTGAGGTGAPATYTWSLVGTVPGGVSLSTTTGATTQLVFPGVTLQTVSVRCANGATGEFAEETFTLNDGGGGGGGTLNIDTTSLPNGQVGVAYNAPITASGTATGPFTWSLQSGTLPNGLTLDTASTSLNSSLSGNPTTANNFTFTVQITNGSVSDTQTYNVQITAAGVLTILTTSLGGGTNGTLYSGGAITSAGGTGAHTWSLSIGTLPTGLALGTGPGANTAITGTPTQTGSFPITVQVVDSSVPAAQTDTQAFTLVIAAGGGGGGGGLSGGGGGGGGGCVVGNSTAWMLGLGLLALFGLALRTRSRKV